VLSDSSPKSFMRDRQPHAAVFIVIRFYESSANRKGGHELRSGKMSPGAHGAVNDPYQAPRPFVTGSSEQLAESAIWALGGETVPESVAGTHKLCVGTRPSATIQS